MKTESFVIGRETMTRTLCEIHSRVDPDSISKSSFVGNVAHPSFKLRTPARSQVRAITIAVNQDAWERVMARVDSGEFKSAGECIQRALEGSLGMFPGTSEQDSK
jgi:hypothetical protein